MAKKHKNLDNIPIQWDGDLTDPPYGAGNQGQSIPTNVDLGTWSDWWVGTYVPDYSCPMKQSNPFEPQCYWEDYNINSDGTLNVLDMQAWGQPQFYDYFAPELQPDPNNLVSTYNPYLLCLGDGGGGSPPIWPNTGLPCSDLWPELPGTSQGDGLGYLLGAIIGDYPSPPGAMTMDNYGNIIINKIDQSKIYSGWNSFVPGRGNPYTWGDVSFVQEIADGIGTGNRRAREARLHKFDKDTKKRLIHLICRVKGEKVYDEEKEVGDIQIKLEDADLVINEVLGKMRVENINVL